jgi:hypothetical protein
MRQIPIRVCKHRDLADELVFFVAKSMKSKLLLILLQKINRILCQIPAHPF